jgi:hypothetical protein
MVIDGQLTVSGDVSDIYVNIFSRDGASLKQAPEMYRVLGDLDPLGENGSRTIRLTITAEVEEEEA